MIAHLLEPFTGLPVKGSYLKNQNDNHLHKFLGPVGDIYPDL